MNRRAAIAAPVTAPKPLEAIDDARDQEVRAAMTAPKRPVYPVPFADAMRGLPTLHAVGNVTLSDLSMRCLARAYYGGFFRAAVALVRAGIADRWMTACVRVRLAWYRVLGLTEEQIDQRFR